jgi:FecR-like protein
VSHAVLCLRVLAAVHGILLGASTVIWAQQGSETIGVVAAVHGSASVMHAGAVAPARLAVRQTLSVNDAVETKEQAKVQTLFQDDTMLTMGQQTRVEIAEYLHDPDQHVRRMTVHLVHGTVRALVGRAFTGLGSMFTIHAGTANVLANTTYFVVWSNQHETGVVNIGAAGQVSFTSGGRIVMISSGYYSIALAGKPPSAPSATGSQLLPVISHAIADTEIKDSGRAITNELADKTIEDELRTCPPGSPPGGICPRKPPSPAIPPATPPAVTSGATRR